MPLACPTRSVGHRAVLRLWWLLLVASVALSTLLQCPHEGAACREKAEALRAKYGL